MLCGPKWKAKGCIFRAVDEPEFTPNTAVKKAQALSSGLSHWRPKCNFLAQENELLASVDINIEQWKVLRTRCYEMQVLVPVPSHASPVTLPYFWASFPFFLTGPHTPGSTKGLWFQEQFCSHEFLVVGGLSLILQQDSLQSRVMKGTIRTSLF